MFGAHAAPVASPAPAFGTDEERAALAHDLDHAHEHAGVHGADDHVHLVALHEPVGVLRRLGRVGFVIHREVFDFPAAELAAALRDRQLEGIRDRGAEGGERARVGQHHADPQLRLLGEQRRARNGAPHRQRAEALQESATIAWMRHGVPSLKDRVNAFYRLAASSRSLKRWILPVAVLGRSFTNSIQRGYLCGASRALMCCLSSSASFSEPCEPGFSTT